MVVIMSIRFLRAANSILDTFVGFWKIFWKNICFDRSKWSYGTVLVHVVLPSKNFNFTKILKLFKLHLKRIIMEYFYHLDALLTWKADFRCRLFLEMGIYQNSLQAKNFNFVTARSHRMIINWLLNSMYSFISPISTLCFNPI